MILLSAVTSIIPPAGVRPMKVFSERERELTFTICSRPSVCRLSLCLSSVTLVRPTQAFAKFGNFSTAFGVWGGAPAEIELGAF